MRAAANPRRVRVYVAEKGLPIEHVEITPDDLRSDAFLAKNPAGKVPVLELDDGTYLTESAAIIEYLEERFPSPPMIGETAEERARVRMIERIVSEMFPWYSLYFRHFGPSFLQEVLHYVPNPAIAAAVQPMIERSLGVMSKAMGDHPFLAGDKPSVADCHFYALVSSGRKFSYRLPERFENLNAWFDRFSERPSASAGGMP